MFRRSHDDQMKEFVRLGYATVRADGFPEGWHAALGAEAEAVARACKEATPPITGPDYQDAIWGPLTPRMRAVITCPALRGALTSILGRDFVFGGGAHMHVAGPDGQAYHKDGTPVAVKTHEVRGVIMMYCERAGSRCSPRPRTNPRDCRR